MIPSAYQSEEVSSEKTVATGSQALWGQWQQHTNGEVSFPGAVSWEPGSDSGFQAQSEHDYDLPPLPPSDGPPVEIAAPPLPDGPPPLPQWSEEMPPLPFEEPVSHSAPALPPQPTSSAQYENRQVISQTWTETGRVASKTVDARSAAAAPAANLLESASFQQPSVQADWQSGFYQQQQLPEGTDFAPADAFPAGATAYADAYGFSQNHWQTGSDPYTASYLQQQQQQQQQQQPSQYTQADQYAAYYQQQAQQPWQQSIAAPWHAASVQYDPIAHVNQPAAYPPPDVAQTSLHMYSAYQVATPLQPHQDGFPVNNAHHSGVADGTSAAGLSGPAQTPIVVVEATALFELPGCTSRPKKIAILLRGIPGSGKTHIAQQLRKMELKATGDAPRIHCIDDYFMTEVEREEDDVESGKKGKKRKVQELEYCYEQEMEGSYRKSLLKAYQKTMDEQRFNVVIVDAPNLLVEDFKPYWSAGQRAGYEVYILDPFEGHPETCFKRNIHDRSLEDIQGAAACWEPAPAFYPRLDVASLFRSAAAPAVARSAHIAEVDMDADADAAASHVAQIRSRWDGDEAEGSEDDAASQQVKRSKAANAVRHERKDSANAAAAATTGGKDEPVETLDGLTSGLDGLINPNLGKGKSGPASVAASGKAAASLSAMARRPGSKHVRWADQVEKSESGFSIGGTAALQLETVYVLSGLGPPPQDAQLQTQKGTFAAKARAERSSEFSFKDMMLANKHS